MTDNTYNGWSSYETWLVNVWIGDLLAEKCDDDGDDITADYVQDMVEEIADGATKEGYNGLMTDLLNAAVREINFNEIASHYQEED